MNEKNVKEHQRDRPEKLLSVYSTQSLGLRKKLSKFSKFFSDFFEEKEFF